MGRIKCFNQKKIKSYGRSLTQTLEIWNKEGDWDIIRQTKLYDAAIDDPNIKPGEAMFFKPEDLLKRKDIDVGTRE